MITIDATNVRLALTQLFNRVTKPRSYTGSNQTIIVPLKQAGMNVDHDTALTYAAVYSAVRTISETIAMLPWQAHITNLDGTRKPAPGSPVERLLRNPNQNANGMAFWETMLAHALTWGNAYAEIVRDQGNRPAELYIITPDRVEYKRDADNRLVYEVSNETSEVSYVAPNNMFHLHGVGYDGFVGYSVVSLAARSMGLGMATEQFGASFFQNGAQLGGVLEIPNDSRVGADARKHMLKTFNKEHRGVKNSHKVEMLEGGIQYKEIGIPQRDAQFLETRKFQVTEIARWFRLPPHKLADLERSTFTNIEEQNIDFVTDTLMPWITRLEQEANRKLFNENSRAYTKINVNALLRGDSNSRADFYQKMANLGVYSVNDILELEDRNTIGPDGDKRLVQLNQTTLEKIGEEEPAPAPVPATVEPDINDNELQNALTCVLKRERARFLDIHDRYARNDFVSWLNNFIPEHKAYMKKKLTPAVSDAIRNAGLDIEPDTVVNDYAIYHATKTRKAMLQHYDDGVNYYSDEKEINLGVMMTSTEIIERIADSKQIKVIT